MKIKFVIITILFVPNIIYLLEKNFEEEQPLYLEFYPQPKIIEIPVIDYETIEVPYKKYISAEIKKKELLDKVYISSSTEKIISKSFFWEKSYSFFVETDKIVPSEIFKLKTQNSSKKIEQNKNYNYVDINLLYNKVFDKHIAGFKSEFYSKNFNNSLEQYSIFFNFLKNYFKNICFSYEPEIFYINSSDENFIFYFIWNGLNVSYVPSHNYLFSLYIVPVNINNSFLNYYILKTIIKNYFWYDFKTELSLSVNDKTQDVYFETDLEQKIGLLKIELNMNKKYYYSYLKEYFIKLPYVNFKNYNVIIPDRNEYYVKTTFGNTNSNLYFGYNKIKYDYFPTYKYEGTTVVAYNEIDVEYPLYTLGLKTKNKNIIFTYEINSTADKEEILFIPQQQQNIILEIKFSKLHIKNLIAIKNRMYTNKNKMFLNDNFVYKTDISFLLRDEIMINILYTLPIYGKNYLQPGIYLEPEVMFGMKISF